MNDNRHPREILVEAIGQTLDKLTAADPDLHLGDLCLALGWVAGTSVAVNVPAGLPDADTALGNMVGIGFGEAIKAARQARAS